MRALIVGATAGVGRALSDILAARGNDLLLVASDECDLKAQAAHLRLVYNIRADIVAADASNVEECLERIRLASSVYDNIDAMFFPIGVSRNDDRGTLSLDEMQRLFNINLLIVVGVIGYFLPKLLAADSGNIVGFGSVAAVRGRRANIIYAAAKRGLESYFESLRHLTVQTGISVQFYQLGYVATQQSFGRRLLFPSVNPQDVAKLVICNLNSKRGLIYFPRFWRIVTRIVSALPWPVFKRMDF